MTPYDAVCLIEHPELLEAFRGGKIIEHRPYLGPKKSWVDAGTSNSMEFDFKNYEYRVRHEPKKLMIAVHPLGKFTPVIIESNGGKPDCGWLVGTWTEDLPD